MDLRNNKNCKSAERWRESERMKRKIIRARIADMSTGLEHDFIRFSRENERTRANGRAIERKLKRKQNPHSKSNKFTQIVYILWIYLELFAQIKRERENERKKKKSKLSKSLSNKECRKCVFNADRFTMAVHQGENNRHAWDSFVYRLRCSNVSYVVKLKRMKCHISPFVTSMDLMF